MTVARRQFHFQIDRRISSTSLPVASTAILMGTRPGRRSMGCISGTSEIRGQEKHRSLHRPLISKALHLIRILQHPSDSSVQARAGGQLAYAAWWVKTALPPCSSYQHAQPSHSAHTAWMDDQQTSNSQHLLSPSHCHTEARRCASNGEFRRSALSCTADRA